MEEPFTDEVIAAWKEIFGFVDSNPDVRREVYKVTEKVVDLLRELNATPAAGIAALLVIVLDATQRLIAEAGEDAKKERSGAVH